MLDVQECYINCKEPAVFMGRWTGAGAAVPVAVAKTTRGTGPTSPTGSSTSGGPITIARSGVGTLSVTLPNPVGIIQNYSFWVCTGSSATDKNVRITPVVAGSNTFALQVTFHANGVAVDLAVNDELQMEVISSLSQNP